MGCHRLPTRRQELACYVLTQGSATQERDQSEVTAVSDGSAEREADDAEAWDWIGLLSIILLSVTAIVTAWSGFQASKWGGAMSISFTQAGAARLESATLAAEADRRRAMQAGTFATWLVAEAQGDEKTAQELESRFGEPLKTAFVAWEKAAAVPNQDAPGTPFEMPQYTSAEIEAAAEASQRADALFAEGLANNQRGDNYTLLAVLSAVVLFFTALSTRVKKSLYQWILLWTAVALFTGIVALLVWYPKLL